MDNQDELLTPVSFGDDPFLNDEFDQQDQQVQAAPALEPVAFNPNVDPLADTRSQSPSPQLTISDPQFSNGGRVATSPNDFRVYTPVDPNTGFEQQRTPIEDKALGYMSRVEERFGVTTDDFIRYTPTQRRKLAENVAIADIFKDNPEFKKIPIKEIKASNYWQTEIVPSLNHLSSQNAMNYTFGRSQEHLAALREDIKSAKPKKVEPPSDASLIDPLTSPPKPDPQKEKDAIVTLTSQMGNIETLVKAHVGEPGWASLSTDPRQRRSTLQGALLQGFRDANPDATDKQKRAFYRDVAGPLAQKLENQAVFDEVMKQYDASKTPADGSGSLGTITVNGGPASQGDSLTQRAMDYIDPLKSPFADAARAAPGMALTGIAGTIDALNSVTNWASQYSPFVNSKEDQAAVDVQYKSTDAAVEYLRETAKWANDSLMLDEAQTNMAELGTSVNNGDWTGAAKSLTKPHVIGTLVGQAAGYSVGAGAPAAAALKGVVSKAATAIVSGTVASSATADVVDDATDMVEGMTDAEIKLTPAYQEFQAAQPGATHAQLRDQVREQTRTMALTYGGAGALAGILLGSSTEAMLVKGAVSKSVKGAIGKGAIEATGEFIEEGAQNVAQDVGVTNKVDLKRAAAAGTVGAAAGGLVGTALNLPTKRSDLLQNTPLQNTPVAATPADVQTSAPADVPADKGLGSPSDIKQATAQLAVERQRIIDDTETDQDERDITQTERRAKVMLEDEGLNDSRPALASAPLSSDPLAKNSSSSNMQFLSPERQERARSYKAARRALLDFSHFTEKMDLADTLKDQRTLIDQRLSAFVDAYAPTYGDKNINPSQSLFERGVELGFDPQIATDLASELAKVSPMQYSTVLDRIATGADPSTTPAMVHAAADMAADYGFYAANKAKRDELRRVFAPTKTGSKQRTQRSLQGERDAAFENADALARQLPARPIPAPPVASKLPQGANAGTSPADMLATLDRVTEPSQKSGLIKSWWRNTLDTETNKSIKGMLKRFHARMGQVVSGMDDLDTARDYDGFASKNFKDWKLSDAIHPGAMRARRLSHQYGALMDHHNHMLGAKIEQAASEMGLSDNLPVAKQTMSMFIHALDTPAVIDYMWRTSTDNHDAFNKAGRDEWRNIQMTYQHMSNITDADAVHWKDRLDKLINDPNSYAPGRKVINKNDMIWYVQTPEGLKPMTLQSAKDLVDTMRAGPYGKALDAVAEQTAVMTENLRKTQAIAVNQGPQRNLLKLGNRKYYLPNTGKDSDDRQLQGLGDDVEINYINRSYKAMANRKIISQIEADTIEKALRADDPFTKLAGMSLHASRSIYTNGVFDKLSPFLKKLNRASVGRVIAVQREYNDKTGGFEYGKLPSTLDAVDFLHRLDDGTIEVISLSGEPSDKSNPKTKVTGQHSLLELINVGHSNPSREGLGWDVLRGGKAVSRGAGRALTSMNIKFVMATEFMRSMMTAAMTAANTQGVKASGRMMHNAFTSGLMNAAKTRRFYSMPAHDVPESMLKQFDKDPYLKYVAERHRIGGRQNFAQQLGGADTLRRNVLESPSVLTTAAEKLDPAMAPIRGLTDFMDGIATTADNLWRDATYAALREGGMEPETAESHVSNMMNTSQRVRNRFAQDVFGLYAFAASGVTGLHTTLTRHFYKGNDIPVTTYVSAEGNDIVAPDWANLLPGLSKPAVSGFIGMSFASTMLTAAMLGAFGDDDDNEFKRMKPSTFLRNYVLPFGLDTNGHETPFRVSVQYGVPMLMHAVGGMAALLALGQHDAGEIGLEGLGVFTASMVPIGNVDPANLHAAYQREGINGAQRTIATSIMPTAVRPLAGNAMNRDAFGATVFDEAYYSPTDSRYSPSLNASPKRDRAGQVEGRSSTGQLYKDIAAFMTDAADAGVPGIKGLNLESPEAVRQLVKSYTPGVIGGTAEVIRDVFNIVGRAGTDPNFNETQAMVDNFAPLVSTSGDSIYFERNKVTAFSLQWNVLDRERAVVARKDVKSLGDAKRPENYVGPLEKQWRADNPDWLEVKTIQTAGFKEIAAYNDQIAEIENEPNSSAQVYAIRSKINDTYVSLYQQLREVAARPGGVE